MRRSALAAGLGLAATAAVIWHERVRIERVAYEYSPRRHLKRWTERARFGYSEEDVFDFDGFLARVISGGVNDIRDWLHGHPGTLSGLEEWGTILDEIVLGFTIYAEEGGWPMGEGKDEDAKKVERAMDLFAAWFPHLWD